MSLIACACCGAATDAVLPRLSCAAVTAPPSLALSTADEERHTIYLMLAMALVFDGWGVNRSRREQVATYAAAAAGRAFPDYLGHNVGALLVAPDGAILCFALNRNVALNSTLEHAELRAVRHAIEAANAAAGPGGAAPWSFGTLLQGFHIYVTLEPCSQCSGILDLARIGSVVYAQDDPGQCGIVNALHNIRRGPGALPAPLPVRAAFFPLWRPLEDAFRRFLAVTPPTGRRGVTSFLETVEAFAIYGAASAALDAMTVRDPASAAILDAARRFRRRRPAAEAMGLIPA